MAENGQIFPTQELACVHYAHSFAVIVGRSSYCLTPTDSSAPRALLRTFDFVQGSKNHAPHKVLKAQFNCLACYIAVTTGHRSCCPVAQIGHLRLSEVKQLGPRDKFQSQAAELKA